MCMYVNICMDELFAESVFTACCMLLWHINVAVSDLYASPRQTASNHRLRMRACLVDAGGMILISFGMRHLIEP